MAQREPPIVSQSWRRVTFILTNGRRFSSASEINELILGPKEHDILWRALKERGLHAERNYVIRDERTVYRVDMAVLAATARWASCVANLPVGANRRVRPFPGEPASLSVLCFTPEQVESGLNDCLAAVQAACQRLGGIIRP